MINLGWIGVMQVFSSRQQRQTTRQTKGQFHVSSGNTVKQVLEETPKSKYTTACITNQTDKSKTGLIHILLTDDCATKQIQSEAFKLQIYRNCRMDAS